MAKFKRYDQRNKKAGRKKEYVKPLRARKLDTKSKNKSWENYDSTDIQT